MKLDDISVNSNDIVNFLSGGDLLSVSGSGFTN